MKFLPFGNTASVKGGLTHGERNLTTGNSGAITGYEFV